MVDKAALGQAFMRVLGLCIVGIIPQNPHAELSVTYAR
jgi:hypothetical protein